MICMVARCRRNTIRRIIHKVHGEFFPDSYSDVDIDEMEM